MRHRAFYRYTTHVDLILTSWNKSVRVYSTTYYIKYIFCFTLLLAVNYIIIAKYPYY